MTMGQEEEQGCSRWRISTPRVLVFSHLQGCPLTGTGSSLESQAWTGPGEHGWGTVSRSSAAGCPALPAAQGAEDSGESALFLPGFEEACAAPSVLGGYVSQSRTLVPGDPLSIRLPRCCVFESLVARACGAVTDSLTGLM